MLPNLSRQLLLKQLERLIAELIGDRGPLPESIAINHDLRLEGDDSDDFLTEIQNRYGTRFDGMVWNQYSQPDSEAQFDFLPRMFGIKPKTKRLTVGHLLDVIERGAWFEPPGG
jgi:hypothetical protein